MTHHRLTAALVLCLLAGGPSLAQTATDPARLAAAKEMVAQMQGDRTAVLQSLTSPMVAMLGQMGIKEPERAQVLWTEVVRPVLESHLDSLQSANAEAYAAALSESDLRAATAFYSSPAGRNFANAQPRIAQAQMTGMSRWMAGIAPEIQRKVTETVKQKGWDKPAR